MLDIGPGGALTVYSTPSIFTTDGVRPIAVTSSIRQFAISRAQLGDVDSLLYSAAGRYAIRSGLLQSVAWQESHFHNESISPKGAVGIMQLMPDTARLLGVDPYVLSDNIMGGAAYLRQMLNRFGGDEALALAAYNAGPGAVSRAGGIPRFKETRNYVGAVLGVAAGVQPPSPFVLFIDR